MDESSRSTAVGLGAKAAEQYSKINGWCDVKNNLKALRIFPNGYRRREHFSTPQLCRR